MAHQLLNTTLITTQSWLQEASASGYKQDKAMGLEVSAELHTILKV